MVSNALTYLAHYRKQGYRLPPGMTAASMIERQKRWEIRPYFMPLALAPGVIAWGVPFLNGAPLDHNLALEK